jgi:hypothetical protein
MGKSHVGLEPDRVGRRNQAENVRLKQLVADLTLDKTMLQDVLARIMEARREVDADPYNDRAGR